MNNSDDKNELISSINNIRNRFKTEVEDPSEQQLSFIDELNELIRKIFKDDPADIYTTLSPGELEKWKKKRIRRWVRRTIGGFKISNIPYFLLLSTITGFLVSEAVSFYAGEGSSDAKTWLKAILTEVCFIFLSGYRATGVIASITAGFLRTTIFCLMMFVITSDISFKTVVASSEANKISEQVKILEDQIKNKEETVDFFKKKGWGVSVNRQEKELDGLREKLNLAREKQIEGKSVEVTEAARYKSYVSAAFRVLLLLISVLISRRIFKF